MVLLGTFQRLKEVTAVLYPHIIQIFPVSFTTQTKFNSKSAWSMKFKKKKLTTLNYRVVSSLDLS